MTSQDDSDRTNPVIERIKQRLEVLKREKGVSARKASMEAGLSPDGLRGVINNPHMSPTLATINKLARGLETDPLWLAFGIEREPGMHSTHELMPVLGEVAAGIWKSLGGAVDQTPFEPAPIPYDPRYPREAQFGLVVRGTSINRIARDGDILKCIHVGRTGLAPQDDDLVIVELTKAQGGLREQTAKRYRRRCALIELAPDSDDPAWQEPMVFDPNQRSEDERVEIIAIVDGAYRSLRRSRR